MTISWEWNILCKPIYAQGFGWHFQPFLFTCNVLFISVTDLSKGCLCTSANVVYITNVQLPRGYTEDETILTLLIEKTGSVLFILMDHRGLEEVPAFPFLCDQHVFTYFSNQEVITRRIQNMITEHPDIFMISSKGWYRSVHAPVHYQFLFLSSCFRLVEPNVPKMADVASPRAQK